MLFGRFTAAAPGATEFLGDAISSIEGHRAVAKEGSALALAFGILWKLLLVAALIWVTVWLLRRTMGPGGLPLGAAGPIQVLATQHLDARSAVYLLEIGERLLVVGAGGGALSLLAEITSPVERATIRERLLEGRGQFGSYLSAWASKMSGGGGASEQLKAGKEFLTGRIEEMRRQRKTGRGDKPGGES
jgi:flagellar biogenesis protein FliO